MPQWARDILIAVLIIFGGVYLLLTIGSTASRDRLPAPTADSSSVAVGSEGQLRSGSSLIPVAVDEELLSDVKRDRKSTRLNSSHLGISYAVFCLKKKKTERNLVIQTHLHKRTHMR